MERSAQNGDPTLSMRNEFAAGNQELNFLLLHELVGIIWLLTLSPLFQVALYNWRFDPGG